MNLEQMIGLLARMTVLAGIAFYFINYFPKQGKTAGSYAVAVIMGAVALFQVWGIVKLIK
ncbi:MAG: hypothetical protein HY714_03495 [Candidatus Omnitrophica bacterium]|nr:hypothetical protein [Candidatus Omnitrophota bacterium]